MHGVRYFCIDQAFHSSSSGVQESELTEGKTIVSPSSVNQVGTHRLKTYLVMEKDIDFIEIALLSNTTWLFYLFEKMFVKRQSEIEIPWGFNSLMAM